MLIAAGFWLATGRARSPLEFKTQAVGGDPESIHRR